jgi:hypothetical protein
MQTPRSRRVKAVPFKPELLERIQRDANERGESFGDWIEKAALERLEFPQDKLPPRRPENVVHSRPQPFSS